MDKRGVSIFVFTIIFTVVAGAIILVFFFSFGKGLLGFSGNVTKIENLLVLEKNLGSFALAPNAEKIISFSEDSKIDLNCNQNTGKIELWSAGEHINTDKLIFTPFQIKGKSVQAWTLSWNYPFKIDNLYFVADSGTTFYFPDLDNIPGSLSTYFFNKFSKKFNHRTNLPSNPQFEDKAVVVYFKSPPPSLPNNIKVVQFIDLDKNTPKVKFNQGSETPILGDSMVYAAIFTADYANFNCIMNNIAKPRIKKLAEIYLDTVEKLKKANGCDNDPDYREIRSDLEKLQNDQEKTDSAKTIKLRNEDLKTTNCPVLYSSTETLRLLQ